MNHASAINSNRDDPIAQRRKHPEMRLRCQLDLDKLDAAGSLRDTVGSVLLTRPDSRALALSVMRDDKMDSGRSDDQHLLARAFSANAEKLTESELERLELILAARTSNSAAESDEANETDEADSVVVARHEPENESTRSGRVPRPLIVWGVSIVIAAASFGAGIVAHQVASPSPYLTRDQVLAKTGKQIAFPVDVAPPTSAGFDPGSLYLSGDHRRQRHLDRYA